MAKGEYEPEAKEVQPIDWLTEARNFTPEDRNTDRFPDLIHRLSERLEDAKRIAISGKWDNARTLCENIQEACEHLAFLHKGPAEPIDKTRIALYEKVYGLHLEAEALKTGQPLEVVTRGVAFDNYIRSVRLAKLLGIANKSVAEDYVLKSKYEELQARLEAADAAVIDLRARWAKAATEASKQNSNGNGRHE
jgi:hypothetical protein